MSFSIYRFISAFHTQSESRKVIRFVYFSVFSFGCLGRNLRLRIDFVTC